MKAKTLSFLQIIKNRANSKILIYGAPDLTGGKSDRCPNDVKWRHVMS